MAESALPPNRLRIALRDYRVRLASSVIGVLIMIVLAAVMLSRVEFSALAGAFQSAQPGWLLIASALFLTGQVLRILRTQQILRAHMALGRVASAQAVLGGQLINWLSPVRVGDVWRIMRTCDGKPERLAWTIAGLVVEKSADALALAIFALTVTIAPLPVVFASPLSRLLLTGLGGMLIATAVAALTSTRAQQKIAARIPKAAALFRFAGDEARLAQSADVGVVAAVAPVGSLRATWLSALPLSIAIWLCAVCANTALSWAFGIEIGWIGQLLLMLALQTSTVFSPVPGNVGVLSIVAVGVMVPLGVASAAALAFGATLWALAYGAVAMLAAAAYLLRKARG
jgi:uncharacterized membrane protein YbhN (UPF0104 family)